MNRQAKTPIGSWMPGIRSTKACYASAVNSLVIRSTGELAKCTVALSHPNNRVGRLLDDGRLEIDDGKLEGWTRGIWSGVPEELHCPMHGFAAPEFSDRAPGTCAPV